MNVYTKEVGARVIETIMENVAVEESGKWLEECDVVEPDGRLKDGYYMVGDMVEDGKVEFKLFKLPKPFSTLTVSVDVPEVTVSVKEDRTKKVKTDMKLVADGTE